jgi:rod shape-determining protein MreC
MRDVALNLSGAPGGVEQVLVVLEGVHQPIPAAPVAPKLEQAVAPGLAAPPPDTTDPAHTGRPETEADKIVQRYADIGKEENHTFGAYGSNMPNFNPKPQASVSTNTPTPANPGTTRPETKPPADRPPASGILGARPGAPLPALTQKTPAEHKLDTPGLLGSPKRKPAAEPELPKTLPGDE